MSYGSKCNFSRGEGFSYGDVVHLLQGTRKPKIQGSSSGGDPYFLDENIRGYGWGDNQDLKEINEMELGIGPLSQELRDLRTMVDFCCIWRYDYPQRVHDICKAIGGKGTMLSRCHYQVGPEKRDELIAYARALKKWLGQTDYEDTSLQDRQMVEEVENRVFTMLGDREKVKDLLVERTFIGLACRNIDCSFFGSRGDGQPEHVFPSNASRLDSDWRSRMRMIEKEILSEMGGDAYDFFCEVGGAEPACHFKFIRRLEILIGSIGCLKWRGYLPPKDSKVSGRRQVTQRYLSVLQTYWSDSVLPNDEQDNDLLSLQEDLFDALGKPELHKRWLIASLWKNIKNQTEHQAFTMKHWVEFVQITRSLMNSAYDEV
jgi:hypothetical protein